MLEYMLYKLLQVQDKNKNKSQENFYVSSSQESSITATTFVFWVVVGFFGIYLSWTCNSASNTPTLLKVIYAFFAWFFGIFYLIFYYFYNYLGKQCGK